MIHNGYAPELVDGIDGLDGFGGLEPWDGHAPELAAPLAHPREALDTADPAHFGVPIRAEGQDLSGGHQGVDVTVTLIQPAAGARIDQTAVAQALGRDYQRLEARIVAVDGPVYVATSKEQAEQAYAQGATISSSGQTTLAQTAPAAGANFTYTNTTGAPQTLESATATFTADATVVNRFLSLQILDAAGHILAKCPNQTAVAASANVGVWWMQGITQQNSGSGTAAISLASGLVVPPGGQVLIVASGIDAADQWNQISLTFAGAGSSNIQEGPWGWLPPGVILVRRNCDEVWLALPGAAAATTHVTIAVSRRLGVEPPTLART